MLLLGRSRRCEHAAQAHIVEDHCALEIVVTDAACNEQMPHRHMQVFHEMTPDQIEFVAETGRAIGARGEQQPRAVSLAEVRLGTMLEYGVLEITAVEIERSRQAARLMRVLRSSNSLATSAS